jgi:hypothetical protein
LTADHDAVRFETTLDAGNVQVVKLERPALRRR